MTITLIPSGTVRIVDCDAQKTIVAGVSQDYADRIVRQIRVERPSARLDFRTEWIEATDSPSEPVAEPLADWERELIGYEVTR